MAEQPCVLIGCPWYTQCRGETAFSMAQTYLRLAMDGPAFISGIFDCPSVAHARNRLITQFMAQKQCTHLLMVDADMSWEVEAVIRMLEHDVPFVAAAGADKRTGKLHIGEPGKGSGGRARVNYDQRRGLLEVPRIGACFMLIRRDCVEQLMAAHTELHLEHEDVHEELRPFYYAFFQTRAEDGWMPTEDFFFCDLLHKAGIPVLADPWIELGHTVPQTLRGKLMDVTEF